MVGSSKGNHLVYLVAGYLPASLEEELYLVQLYSVSTRCRNPVIAAYLFRVELPSHAERCPQGSPQRLEEGHSQVHLIAMSAFRRDKGRIRSDPRPWGWKESSKGSSDLDNCTSEAVERKVKVPGSCISSSSLVTM